MGARTNRSKKQDNRPPNFQPNHLPPSLGITLNLGGEKLGTIAVPQAAKLSERGNITFTGGIKAKEGWVLGDEDAEPTEVLDNITLSIEGKEMKRSSSGVHQSKAGNPTVCHVASLDVAVPSGEPISYTAQVYVTYVEDKEAYSLSASIFKAPEARAGGPGIIGALDGDFTFRPKEQAAA